MSHFHPSVGAMVIVVGIFLPLLSAHGYSGQGERLVKAAETKSVYVIREGKRYVFPDQRTYTSWYGNDFSKVEAVPSSEVTQYLIGGNVTHKAGALIKITSDPRVYEVLDANGTIQWVPSEAQAAEKFGPQWAKLVADVSTAYFVNYQIVGEVGEHAILPDNLDQTPPEPTKEKGLLRLTNNKLVDRFPAVVWSGKKMGLVWSEEDYSSSRIRAAVVERDGTIVQQLTVSNPDFHSVTRHDILWDGSSFVITFFGLEQKTFRNALYLVKIDEFGRVVLPETKIMDTKLGVYADVAFDGQAYGLVWEDIPPGVPLMDLHQEIYFQKFDANGKLMGAKIMISADNPSAQYDASTLPRIHWTGLNFGIFWVEHQHVGSGGVNQELYFSTVNPEGSVVIPSRRLTFSADKSTYLSSTIWDGSGYAVTYTESSARKDEFENFIHEVDAYLLFLNDRGEPRLSSPVKLGKMNKVGHGNTAIVQMNNRYYVASEYQPEVTRPNDGSEIMLYVIDGSGEIERETRLTFDPWQSGEPSMVVADEKISLVWTDGRGCPECQQGNKLYREEIWYTQFDPLP